MHFIPVPDLAAPVSEGEWAQTAVRREPVVQSFRGKCDVQIVILIEQNRQVQPRSQRIVVADRRIAAISDAVGVNRREVGHVHGRPPIQAAVFGNAVVNIDSVVQIVVAYDGVVVQPGDGHTLTVPGTRDVRVTKYAESPSHWKPFGQLMLTPVSSVK